MAERNFAADQPPNTEWRETEKLPPLSIQESMPQQADLSPDLLPQQHLSATLPDLTNHQQAISPGPDLFSPLPDVLGHLMVANHQQCAPIPDLLTGHGLVQQQSESLPDLVISNQPATNVAFVQEAGAQHSYPRPPLECREVVQDSPHPDSDGTHVDAAMEEIRELITVAKQ